ncbi:MAG: GNAT family N-acetyltransferase [Verrucomicrobia bacterium]|nr:GNAT family N-acetyltransferase [Verrucomicrobiota bacterium]
MSAEPEFRIEPLDLARHRRAEFDCGNQALTDYLRQQARKDMTAKVAACFVLVPVEDTGLIAGYYTLSAVSISLTKLPPELSKKIPKYPDLPATLLGRLARDVRFRGQGVGDRLMASALAKAGKNSAEIGSMAIVTDPKDEAAGKFYSEFGFRELTETRLFLPMQGIPKELLQ